jgi:hypothetical protein
LGLSESALRSATSVTADQPSATLHLSVGTGRAGAAAAAFGTIPAVLIGGFCTIAVVLVSTRIFRGLYQADRYEPTKP